MLFKTSYRMKPPVSARLISGHPLADKLVGCYLLNEGSGVKAFDKSKNGRVVTLVNTPVWMAAQYVGLDFEEGSAQYGLVSEQVVDDEPITLVSGFRLESLPGAGAFDVICATGTVDVGVSGDTYFALRIDENGKVNATKRDGTLNVESSAKSTVISTGVDYVAAAVYKNNDSRKIYVNGVYLGNDTTTVNDGSTTIDRFSVGGLYTKSSPQASHYFDGLVYYVMVYSRVLTPSDIAKLHVDRFCMFERRRHDLYG